MDKDQQSSNFPNRQPFSESQINFNNFNNVQNEQFFLKNQINLNIKNNFNNFPNRQPFSESQINFNNFNNFQQNQINKEKYYQETKDLFKNNMKAILGIFLQNLEQYDKDSNLFKNLYNTEFSIKEWLKTTSNFFAEQYSNKTSNKNITFVQCMKTFFINDFIMCFQFYLDQNQYSILPNMVPVINQHISNYIIESKNPVENKYIQKASKILDNLFSNYEKKVEIEYQKYKEQMTKQTTLLNQSIIEEYDKAIREKLQNEKEMLLNQPIILSNSPSNNNLSNNTQ